MIPDRAVAFRAGPRELADQSDLFFFAKFDLPKWLFNRTKLGANKRSGARKFDFSDAFASHFDGGFGDDAKTAFHWANRTPAIGIMPVDFDDLPGGEFLCAVVNFPWATSYQRVVFGDQGLVGEFDRRALRGSG